MPAPRRFARALAIAVAAAEARRLAICGQAMLAVLLLAALASWLP